MENLSSKRSVARLQNAQSVTDGDGVKIKRSVAHRALETFDPFLLLDEFVSDEVADYIGGFPEHPHRGFETVTYMLEGTMKHRDHMGNEGLLVSGSVQWMTAGRGVLHSEMPQQNQGRMHGFQLWVNLPASEKMSAPNYREYGPEQIPEVYLSANSSARIIAGNFSYAEQTTSGPITDVTTSPDYFDISLAKNEQLCLPIAFSKRVLLYVYQGAINLSGDAAESEINQQQLAMLDEGHSVEISAISDSRFLFLAAIPINEPVVNWGPFVMNTQEEIEQAIADYRSGNLV